MKKIIVFIIGIVFVGIVGAVAANSILSSNISYKGTTVEATLNDLYTRVTETLTNLQNQNSTLTATNTSLLEQNETLTQDKATLQAQLNNIPASAGLKFCRKTSGTLYAIGSEYSCNLGDNVQRTFYLLALSGEEAKLIMDRNITSDTTKMTWNNAMAYFDTGAGATYKTSWTNVLNIDLPMAQDIVNAVGNSSWKAYNKTSSDWFCFGSKGKDYPSSEPYCNKNTNKSKAWLFNHLVGCATYGCTSTDTISTSTSDSYVFGYWSRDTLYGEARAWGVDRHGIIDRNEVTNSIHSGVRPVVTVLKSNLYSE